MYNCKGNFMSISSLVFSISNFSIPRKTKHLSLLYSPTSMNPLHLQPWYSGSCQILRTFHSRTASPLSHPQPGPHYHTLRTSMASRNSRMPNRLQQDHMWGHTKNSFQTFLRPTVHRWKPRISLFIKSHKWFQNRGKLRIHRDVKSLF